MQSSGIPKENHTTTFMYTVDGNKHVQDDKHVYTKVVLLDYQIWSMQTISTNVYHQ